MRGASSSLPRSAPRANRPLSGSELVGTVKASFVRIAATALSWLWIGPILLVSRMTEAAWSARDRVRTAKRRRRPSPASACAPSPDAEAPCKGARD